MTEPSDLLSLKTAEEITADLINLMQARTSRITDYNIGSVIRTIMEAVADAVRGNYDVLEQVFSHAYIGTAQGYALDLKAGDIGILRKPASAALVTLTFMRATPAAQDISIPKGTTVCTVPTSSAPSIQYATTQDAILAQGSNSVDVPAQCIANFDDGESFASAEVTVTTQTNGKNTLTFALPQGCSGRAYRGIESGEEVLLGELYPGATSFTDAGQFSPGSRRPPVIGYDQLPYPSGVSVATAAGGSLPAGTYYYVLTATYPNGQRGNVSAGTIIRFVNQPAGIETVTNSSPAGGGSPAETDTELRARVPQYLANLARATKSALEYGALLIPGVHDAKVVENFPAYGICMIYISDQDGNASAGLIAQVALEIENWRAAGIRVMVQAPTVILVNVACAVTLSEFSDAAYVLNQIEEIVSAWILTHQMGDDVIYSKLSALVADVAGVDDVVFAAPVANISIVEGEIARPGIITVTEAV